MLKGQVATQGLFIVIITYRTIGEAHDIAFTAVYKIQVIHCELFEASLVGVYLLIELGRIALTDLGQSLFSTGIERTTKRCSAFLK